MEKSIHDLIVNLKEVRETSKQSYEDIVRGVEANGEAVSLTTVRKIFAEGSEDVGSFKWKTLQPIARLLLGFDASEIYNPSNAKLYFEQLEAAKADIEYREKEKALLLQHAEERTEAIAALRKQLKTNRFITFILAASMFVLAVAVLILDFTNPDIGFFYHG